MLISKKALIAFATLIVSCVSEVSCMESDNNIKQFENDATDIKKTMNSKENVRHEDYFNDEIEATFWRIMPPEMSYKILAGKYPIPSTNWSDKAKVEQRRAKLNEELQADLENRKEALGAKFQDMSDKSFIITDGNLAFEKLYAKYSYTEEITLSEKEYCDVFTLINLARGIGCEWHNGYKWFDRLTTHRIFVINNIANDEMVTKNEKLLNLFLKIIYDDSIGYRHDRDNVRLLGNVEFLVWDWFGEGYEKILVSEEFKEITVDKVLFHMLQNYNDQLPSIHQKFPNYNWKTKNECGVQ